MSGPVPVVHFIAPSYTSSGCASRRLSPSGAIGLKRKSRTRPWLGRATSPHTEHMLGELEAHGLVERRDGPGAGEWRATPLAVEAITEAYADHHPLVDDQATNSDTPS